MNYKSLDERYSKSILLKLLDEKKDLTITQFLDIVNSYKTIKDIIKKLEEDGLVRIEEKVMGRKTIYVSLTEKGRAVAEKLKEAEEVAKVKPEDLEKYKNLHALQHFNMYQDHVTITDISMQGVRYVNIYARPRGNVLYFYCEYCGSDDCYHIGFIFFDSKLREFVKKWIDDNGYRLAKKYEKYVEKYW